MADLGASVEKALWEVHQLERTVQNVTDVSAPLLSQRINLVAERLTELRTVAGQCAVLVPAAAVTTVDEGRNPDTYVVSCAADAIAANQLTKGRVQSIKSLCNAITAEALAWEESDKLGSKT